MLEQEQRHPLHKTPHEVLLAYLQAYEGHQLLGDIIEGTDIIRTVMSTVMTATSSIVMTMNIPEELNSPLPTDYHLLLSQKLEEDIEITRIGFGTEQEFLKVAQTHSFPLGKFTFKHNPDLEEYQRMILIDGAVLFFRHDTIFFRSTDPTLIEQFQQYIFLVSRSKTDG